MREMVIVFPTETKRQQEAEVAFRGALVEARQGFRTRMAWGWWEGSAEECEEFVLSMEPWQTVPWLALARACLKQAHEKAIYYVDTTGEMHIDRLD